MIRPKVVQEIPTNKNDVIQEPHALTTNSCSNVQQWSANSESDDTSNNEHMQEDLKEQTMSTTY